MEPWFDRRIAGIGGALLALMISYFLLAPSWAETTRHSGEAQPVNSFSYELRSLLPRHVLIASAPCPDRMIMGGRKVSVGEMPCAVASGVILFKGFIPSGVTTVEISFDEPVKTPGTLAKTALPDPLLILFLLAGTCLSVLLLRGARITSKWLVLIVLAAALVRLSYAQITPPWVREHDTRGHVQYIEYLREHQKIPHALEGWEFHQSPAYYVFTALWADMRGLERLQYQPALLNLQGLSILISLAGIPFVVWIALLLFRRRSAMALLLFTALAVLNPATVFMTSQISNDVLQALMSFAFFALLLKWWESGTRRDWIVLCVVISLGILTKMSSLLFIVIAGICLLMRDRDAGLLVRRVLEGGVITGALSGWLVIRRLFLEGDLSRFARTTGFEGYESMYVGTRIADYLVFRPWFVLAVPYNSTREEGFGRQYFWEYAFKSLLTGEWNFGPFLLPFATLMMFCAMGGMAIGAVALWRSPRSQSHPAAIPVAVTLVVSIAALAAYRLTGYACNQDVRFVPLLCVPFAYYLVRGWESLQGRWKTVMYELILILAVTQGLFLLLL